MRGPRRVEPRRPVRDSHLATLLRYAEAKAFEALANDHGSRQDLLHRQRAEQDLLLVRLAADSGARRGELTALRFDDLDRRVLTIARSVSGDEVTTPKSGRTRTLTLGATAARLWHSLEAEWRERAGGQLGPWVFSPDPQHDRRLTAGALGHRFERPSDTAGVQVTLHQLRHNVATFLVARGELLQAQARLGHADPATTLREYAYALPLTDGDIADSLDHHLDQSLTAEPDTHQPQP
jgi:integrase